MHEPPPDSEYITPRRSTPLWAVFLWVIGGCAVIIGILAVLGGFLMFDVLSVRSGPPPGNVATCPRNLKQVATGMNMYIQDWDDRLPPKGQWQSGVMPYVKNSAVFLCPDRPAVSPGYAFNAALDRRTLKQIAVPTSAPMLFDSSLGVPEASDKLQSFVTPHSGAGMVAYVDGHVVPVSTTPSAAAGLANGLRK